MIEYLFGGIIEYYFCFENRLILKSPKLCMSLSFVLIFKRCSVIVSVKLTWPGGW